MASISLESFFPVEETSSILHKTESNSEDYDILKNLVFKNARNEATQEDLDVIEFLLQKYR